MYLEYYGLKEPPFDLTPNPRFLFFSAKHREAFNHLLYGIRERKGFVQLTGEIGAGKTTVCRAMLEALGDSWSTALIFNPPADPDLLLKSVAIEFGLKVAGLDVLEIRAGLNEFLIEQAASGPKSENCCKSCSWGSRSFGIALRIPVCASCGSASLCCITCPR